MEDWVERGLDVDAFSAGGPAPLTWARWPWQACKARTDQPPYAGARCELRPHGIEIDHALERGFDIPRWSTRWLG
jgi:hypothetical protein